MRAVELPEAFRREIAALLGGDAEAFWQAYDRPHKRGLRINVRLGLDAPAPQPALALTGAAPDPYAALALAGDCVAEAVPWQTGAYRIPDGPMPGSSLMHLLGLYYMQEPSAMSAGAALDVHPGMRVLDMCAAPGGKSSQLAAALRGQGLLVSNEPIASRAQMLAGNIERQGFSNVIVTNEYPDKLASAWDAMFDAILVDAPCSGEGMFRRDEEAVRQWSEDAPRQCHERQLTILDSAHALLRPGGAMVYSTCTFNRLENEGTIEEFLRRYDDMEPEDFALPGLGASQGGMLRLWPHLMGGEGHFVCRMRKRADGESPSPRRERRSGNRKAARGAASTQVSVSAAMGRLRDAVALPELSGTPMLFGTRLMLLPEGAPPLDGIRVARAGLELGELGRSHIEPAYALSRALAPDAHSVAVDTPDALRLVRGEQAELCCPDGWVNMVWRGLPVCFGKARGGTVKSHFPRGLKPLGKLTEEL